MNNSKEEALKVFICELAHATRTLKEHNANNGHCDDRFIAALSVNIEHACKNIELGFTGLHLQHENDGRVLIRVSAPGARTSNAFSLSKYSFKEAYLKSVSLRGRYCGFIGTVPIDRLSIPSNDVLLKASLRIKGKKWCAQHDIARYYKHSLG